MSWKIFLKDGTTLHNIGYYHLYQGDRDFAIKRLIPKIAEVKKGFFKKKQEVIESELETLVVIPRENVLYILHVDEKGSV